MRSSKISKRVLGLAMAAALAVGATVMVTGSAEAVTTPGATLSPATGNAAGGTTVVVKGKGFADSTGAVTVLSVRFSSAVCTTTVAGTAATSFNVVSATKAVVVSPALAAGTWYLCLNDAATGSTGILGQGKFVTGAAPTATTITGAVTNVASASVLGGTSITIPGMNFDKTTVAYIDGVATKTTLVSATKISAVLPAHIAGTAYAVTVKSQYGMAVTTDTVSYLLAVAVSPTSSKGADKSVISVTGTGFNAFTFANTPAVNKASVFLVPAGNTTVVVGQAALTAAPSNGYICDTVVVESDSSLSCQLNASGGATAGAYSVLVANAGGTNYATVSAKSLSSTYTVASL